MSTQLELNGGSAELPWMTIARAELGVHELAGDATSKRIAEYYKAVHIDPSHVDDSTTPWCAAFVAWCLTQAGFPGHYRANARSFLDVGVPLLQPKVGCIIVFSRPPNPASGHVGFLAEMPGILASNVMVLGGNEGNSVRVSPYPASRILGWRWPT